jgi:hypothetical protein
MRNTMVGIILIVAAGLIYTVERSMTYYDWIHLRSAVIQAGGGSYESQPALAGLTENLFVPAFLAAGIGILGLNIISRLREADADTAE